MRARWRLTVVVFGHHGRRNDVHSASSNPRRCRIRFLTHQLPNDATRRSTISGAELRRFHRRNPCSEIANARIARRDGRCDATTADLDFSLVHSIFVKRADRRRQWQRRSLARSPVGGRPFLCSATGTLSSRIIAASLAGRRAGWRLASSCLSGLHLQLLLDGR